MASVEIKHTAITEDLRRKILRGVFGEKLPPLRTLMRKYHVAMQTISKAVKPLVSMGLIVPGPRGSVIVAAPKKRPRYYAVGFLWPHGQDFDEEARLEAMYIQDYWARRNYNVLFLNQRNPNLRNKPDFWRTLPIDGLIFAYGTLTAELARAVHEAGIPALAPHFAEDMPVHVMEYDTFPAVERVVKILHEKGFRRIALQFFCELTGYQNMANTRWNEIRTRYGIPEEYRENLMPSPKDTVERHTRHLCREIPPEFILCWHSHPERTLESLKRLDQEKKVRLVTVQRDERWNENIFRLTLPPADFLDKQMAFMEKIIAGKPDGFLHEYVPYLPDFIDDPPEITGRDSKAEVTRK